MARDARAGRLADRLYALVLRLWPADLRRRVTIFDLKAEATAMEKSEVRERLSQLARRIDEMGAYL